jgi:hypothetical protein
MPERSWLALDKDGHIASFSTEGVAGIPSGARTPEHDMALWDELDELAANRLPPGVEVDFTKQPYYFRYCEQRPWGAEDLVAGPYVLSAPPNNPLRMNDCPKHIQKRLRPFRFPIECFSTFAALQPWSHVPCRSSNAIAYVEAGTQRVLPIAGCEEQYRRQFRHLRAKLAEPLANAMVMPVE